MWDIFISGFTARQYLTTDFQWYWENLNKDVGNAENIIIRLCHAFKKRAKFVMNSKKNYLWDILNCLGLKKYVKSKVKVNAQEGKINNIEAMGGFKKTPI